MYLRTPKRYQVGRKPKRHMFSTRFVWLWILTPVIAFLGWQLYERREEFGPPVQVLLNNVVDNAQSSLSTVTAPTPLPTEDPALRIARANSAWQLGSIGDALADYESVLDSVPNEVQIYYNTTFGLIMEGRYDEALVMAERTVTANPFSADAWAIRALALDRDERYAEAIASALQSLSIEPENARALAFMAEAYLDAGRPELAETTVTRALNADPQSYEANYVNGLYLNDALFEYQNARDAFQIAHDLAPNMPYITVLMGWTEVNLQNYERAQELWQGVLELNPNNVEALFGMSWLSVSAFGEQEQGREYIERCLQVSSENRACLRYYGTLQQLAGDSSGALVTFQRLMRTDSTNPNDYLVAAQAFIGAGQCSSAVTALERGYELEQETAFPDTELLATFESLLVQCGADIRREFSADPEATPEVGLEGEVITEGQ